MIKTIRTNFENPDFIELVKLLDIGVENSLCFEKKLVKIQS